MTADDLLVRVKKAMRDGARLDVVRLLFNSDHSHGVHVYEKAVTRGGNDKWVKVTLLLPAEGQTVADVLKMLGDFALKDDDGRT